MGIANNPGPLSEVARDWQAQAAPLARAADERQSFAMTVDRLRSRAFELRFWLIGLVCFLAIVAVAATLLQSPKYLATARIEISRVDPGAAATVEPAQPVIEQRDVQYYQTQYELLKSRFMAERVVEAQNLTQDPAFADMYELTGSASEVEARAADIVLANVTITPIPQSNLVDISYSSPSPQFSARIANSWAEQFLRANFEKRFGDTALSRSSLEDQLQETRAKLENSEAALINYANAHEIVVLQAPASGTDGNSVQSTLVSTRLSSLTTALADASTRRIAAEAALRSGGSDTAASAATLRARLAETRAELAKLGASLGADNPKVRALESERRSLETSLSRESGVSREALQAAYRQARMEEDQLRSNFNDAKANYLAQQSQGVQYGILQREVDTNRQLYEALLQRYKQLGSAGTGANNMTFIEHALPPAKPYEPSLLFNLLLALGAAVVLGAGMVYVVDLLDTAIRDPEQLRRDFNLAMLGLIPQVNDDDVMEQLEDPHSVLSEAYASARVALQYTTAGGLPEAVMITSTRPDEGKTTSALGIAASFAKVSKRVLLVDMDMRRTGLTSLLEAGGTSRGMSDALTGGAQLDDVITHNPLGFDFIPSGRRPPNPAELLAGPQVAGLIKDMRGRYDLVIIDGPPVLGLADAPQLAQSVDGVVYIIQANAGSHRSIRYALARLRDSGAVVLGGILTKLDRRNEGYAYGSGYGYGYGYARTPLADEAA